MELFIPGNNTYFDVRPKPNVRLKPSDSSFYLNLSLEWTLTFEHPYDKEGRWKKIVGDSVVLIESPFHLSKQAFVVDNIRKGLYSITVECHHYFNESVNIQVMDRRVIDGTPQDALNVLLEGSEFNGKAEPGFMVENTIYFIEDNILSFINGDNKENTLLNRFGGEFFYNNRTLEWYGKLNRNKIFRISFGHNLTDLGLEEDWKGVYTRIYPKAYNGRKLPEPHYIDSKKINNYPRVKSTWVDFNNMGLIADYENYNEDNPPDNMILFNTEEELQEAMTKKVNKIYEEGIDIPRISGTLNAAILHNSINRNGVRELPGLGYTVIVTNKLTGIEYKSRIVGIDWNTVKKCYNSIELDDSNDEAYFNKLYSSINTLDKEIEEIKISNKTDWNQIIENTKNELTQYINEGTYYGHVKISKNELLILDNEDLNKAVKVWRWNMGGLGFSLNGYGGPYETAITAAGKMVINEATAETIKATMIKAGVLASMDYSSWFNLDDGTFSWANGGMVWDKESFKIEKYDNKIESLNYKTINLIPNPTAMLTIGGWSNANSNIERYLMDDCYKIEETEVIPPEGSELPIPEEPEHDNVSEGDGNRGEITFVPQPSRIYMTSCGVPGADCSIIKDIDGSIYLIDCGDPTNRNQIVDFMKRLYIEKIDKIFITHMHSDHIGGCKLIFDTFDCKGANIYYKEPDWNHMPEVEIEWETQNYFNTMIQACRDNGIILNNLSSNITLNLNSGSTMEIMNTDATHEPNWDYNERSLFFQYTAYGKKVLFMGDAGYTTEDRYDEWAARNGNVDIIKLGHHGNTGTTSEKWLLRLWPKYCVLNGSDQGAEINLKTKRALWSTYNVYRYSNNTESVDFTIDSNGVNCTGAIYMFKNEWYVRDNGGRFYFKNNGKWAISESLYIDGVLYNFDEHGCCTNPEG